MPRLTKRHRLVSESLGAVPRSPEGINTLMVLLSERHPDAVRCGGMGWGLPVWVGLLVLLLAL